MTIEPIGIDDAFWSTSNARHIVDPAADEVCVAHEADQLLVVAAQLGEHQRRRDKISFVAGQAGQSHDVLDRSERAAANFADALGNAPAHLKAHNSRESGGRTYAIRNFSSSHTV